MSSQNDSKNSKFQEVVASYLDAEAAGQTPDREQLLASHPDLADNLRAFFADHDKMTQMAAQMCDAFGDCPPAESFPQTFGDYELLEEIGRGGMGVVYKARQISLNRIVALKRIRAGQLASPEEVARFRREAEAAAGLDHPHIVPIYEVGEHAGQHYFTMKLIEGGNLNAHLARFADAKSTAELMIKIARAVHHAHQRGILHRDLKPGNILIDADGNPHVSDFGLAQPIEKEAKLTQSGAILGTPEYMAPEQACGEKGLTTAADVYGLGAILYVLLTAKPPFQGDYNWETLKKVVEEDPVSPRSLNRRANRDLEAICLHCLEKSPIRRYKGSAEELANDLQNWMDGKPIIPRPPRLAGRLWKLARRHPARAALVALSIALVVSSGVFSWRLLEEIDAVQRIRGFLSEKKEELAEREEKIKNQEDEITKQKLEILKRDWSHRFDKAKLLRLSGKRWEALAELKRLLDDMKKNSAIGDETVLREEALLAVNTPGVRLVRSIELAERDGFTMAPKFSPDGTAIVMCTNGGREADLRKEKPPMVHSIPLPTCAPIQQRVITSARAGTRRPPVWFAGEGSHVKILEDKGWTIWDPLANKDIRQIERNEKLELWADPDSRGEVILSPDKSWEALGTHIWKASDKNLLSKLPYPVKAFLSNQIVLLHASNGTIAWDVKKDESVFTMPGYLLAALSDDLVLTAQYFRGQRDSFWHFWPDYAREVHALPHTVWSVKEKAKKLELGCHQLDLARLAASVVGSAEGLGSIDAALALKAGAIDRTEIAHTPDWRQAAYFNLQSNATEIWDLQACKKLADLPAVKSWQEFYGRRDEAFVVRKTHRGQFSQDGRRFVYVPEDHPGQMHIWERQSGVVKAVAAESSPQRFGWLSTDGRHLASFPMGDRYSPGWLHHANRPWFEGEKLSIWDLETGTALNTLEVPSNFNGNGTSVNSPNSVTWSPDGRFFIASSMAWSKPHFSVFEVAQPVRDFAVREKVTSIPYTTVAEKITTLRFSPDGRKLAVNGKVWDVEPKKDFSVLHRPSKDSGADLIFFDKASRVWSVSLPWKNGDRPDNEPIRLTISGPEGGTFTLPWPIDTLANTWEFERDWLGVPWVYAFGISPDGQDIVILYGRLENRYGPKEGEFPLLQHWTRKGNRFELAWQIGDVNERLDPSFRKHGDERLWLAPFLGQIREPQPIDQRIAFSQDCKRAFFVGRDMSRALELATKKWQYVRRGWNHGPQFSADGQAAVVDGRYFSKKILLDPERDTLYFEEFKTIPKISRGYSIAALSNDQKYAAFAFKDGVVHLCDIINERVVWQCRPHTQEVTAMAFSPDGKTLVTAGQEGMLRVWHLEQIRQELNDLAMGW